MSHPKITQTITFTDEFTDELDLSPSQVEAIDKLDYEFLKEYTFGISPGYNDKKAKKRHFRSLLLLLDEKQKSDFRDLRKKSREQQKKLDGEFREERFNRSLKKYATLELSRTNFLRFREILKEIDELVHQECIENININHSQINRQERHIELEKKKLKGFLNKGQIKEFFRIKREDHHYGINSRLEMVQYKYSPLKLTDIQAKEIYQFEENEPKYDENAENLSEFEKWGLEKEFMKSILDNEQFPVYLKLKEENKVLFIDGLKETNRRKANEEARLTNRKQYLIIDYLPVKCNWRNNVQKLIDIKLDVEIEKARAEYAKDLISNLKKNFKESIRHNQSYVPNELAVLQLKTQIDSLLPNLICVEQKYRNLLTVLPKRLVDSLSRPDNEMKKADTLLHEFMIKNYEGTGGTYGGWIYVLRKSEKEYGDMAILSNLLLKPTVQENLKMMNQMIEKIDNLDIAKHIQ
ncbi:MAG: hypothetical protein GY936_05250 [Ignavibacteriae bacterium]|nr:hypothetical protein [Ignavibacteriota bacterium]